MHVVRDEGFEHKLRARRMGSHSQQEALVFMRTDCHVCRSEGLTSHSRVLLQSGARQTIATLYQVSPDLLPADEAGLSDAAWLRLGLQDGARVTIGHPRQLTSLSEVRRRIYGHRLSESAFHSIISDIVDGQYSDLHLSSFIMACPTSRTVARTLIRSVGTSHSL